MNNKQKRKLRSRLFVTIVSIIACFAVMGVGAFAASNTFTAQISNQVNIDISKVDGSLFGKRYGDSIYGAVSQSVGVAKAEYKTLNANMVDFVELYSMENGENLDNIAEIQEPVNFNTDNANLDDNNYLEINYLFRFDYNTASPVGVVLTLTDSSTNLKDPSDSTLGSLAGGDNIVDQELIMLDYRFTISNVEPTSFSTANKLENAPWETALENKIVISPTGDGKFSVGGTTYTNNYSVYMFASLKVKRTSSLATAFSLGGDNYHEFIWKFSVNVTPNTVA